MDDSKSNFTNWDAGKGKYSGEYGCVYMRMFNGKWKEVWSWYSDCEDTYKSFVCKATPGTRNELYTK